MEKLGKITLYNADCMEILKQTPDKYYDLCIVDPPYGIGAENHAGKKENGWTQWEKKRWDSKTPDKTYFNELFRVSKNQIIWGGNYMTDSLYPSMGWVIWDKGQRDFSLADGEMAWTSFNKAMRIWDYSRAKNLSEKRIHPTQKPVQLYKWLLNKYAKEGDTILDTHLGSGSSAIAAHDGGFEFTGIELDEEYYNAAKQRLILHQRQLNLF